MNYIGQFNIDMAVTKAWNTVNILVLVLALPIFGNPTCRTRFQAFRAEAVCRAGKNDYILKRGLVSDNNKTLAITLRNCRITDVELGAFKNNYNLQDLNLSLNKIRYLKIGVLDGLPQLISLRLAKNLLTSIPLGLFDQLPKLRMLDISDNKVTSLGLGVFDTLDNLKFLELSGNAFLGKKLNSSLFNRNTKLTHLYFSRNNMSKAPEQLLDAIRGMVILGLNNCSLTEVPKFATRSNLKTLEQLHLQTNDINRLDDPKTFVNLENLISLDLIGNEIEILNESVFKPLSKLRTIDLSFNQIDQIPKTLFRDMVSIQSIDLSYNSIEIVPVDAFRRTHLKTLDLSGNRISYLDKNFCFEVNHFYNKLTTFYFKDNPFQCSCLLDILNEVKKLGIKYNADKYNGEEAVCFMTDAFTCTRHKSIIEYPIDIRQLPSTVKSSKDKRYGTIMYNTSDGVRSTFRNANHLVTANRS